MATFTKDPDEVIDYGWDWSLLLDEGETLTASTWAADDASLTIDDATQFDDTTSAVWVSGGTVELAYRLTNHVTTSAGREFERSHDIYVREL